LVQLFSGNFEGSLTIFQLISTLSVGDEIVVVSFILNILLLLVVQHLFSSVQAEVEVFWADIIFIWTVFLLICWIKASLIYAFDSILIVSRSVWINIKHVTQLFCSVLDSIIPQAETIIKSIKVVYNRKQSITLFLPVENSWHVVFRIALV
jgi:hypothetical protein